MPMENQKKTLDNIWHVLRTIHTNDPEQAEKLGNP